MDAFCQSLNDLLVSAFRSVLKLEEQMLNEGGKFHLSIGEMHILETVGKENEPGRTISEIAKELCLTLPSVTVAVNKLEKKGLLRKARAASDRRSVLVTLTELGGKIERAHRYFHENMVKSIARDMDEREKVALIKGMEKLNLYFDRKLTAR